MKPAWAIGVGAIVADQLLKTLIISANLPQYSGSLYNIWVALSVAGCLLLVVRKRPSVGLILILAGGLSNCLDLVFRNALVDIFVLKNLFFNLADVEIALGACLSIFQAWKDVKSAH